MMTENWVFDAAFLGGVFVFGLSTVEAAGTVGILFEGTAADPPGTGMTGTGGAAVDTVEGKVLDVVKLCVDGLVMVPPINPEA